MTPGIGNVRSPPITTFGFSTPGAISLVKTSSRACACGHGVRELDVEGADTALDQHDLAGDRVRERRTGVERVRRDHVVGDGTGKCERFRDGAFQRRIVARDGCGRIYLRRVDECAAVGRRGGDRNRPRFACRRRFRAWTFVAGRARNENAGIGREQERDVRRIGERQSPSRSNS